MDDADPSSSRAFGRSALAFLLLFLIPALFTTATVAFAAAPTRPVPAPQCATHGALPAYLCVAYAQDPDARCAGHVTVTFTEALSNPAAVAEATGIVMFGDQEHAAPASQPDVLVSCDIAVRASAWRSSPRAQRCVLIAHEVEHLAGHRHYEGTAMNGRPFAPCDVFAPLPDRAITQLGRLRGATNVGCSTGALVVRCDVDFGSRHAREYRVRLTGRDARLIVARVSG